LGSDDLTPPHSSRTTAVGVSACLKGNYDPIIMETMMKKELVVVAYATVRPDFPAYGQSMACYVCGDEHGALNVARIEDDKKTTTVPLCPACVLDKDAVIRKHLKASNLEVHDVTEEQIVGVVESIDKSDTKLVLSSGGQD
jgi:hypothetical protein